MRALPIESQFIISSLVRARGGVCPRSNEGLEAKPAANNSYPCKPADFGLAENTMRYLVFNPPMPDYDHKTFDFDRDIHLLDDWSKQVDAKNPDLSKFSKRGGKLLMTYGWADSILQPTRANPSFSILMAPCLTAWFG